MVTQGSADFAALGGAMLVSNSPEGDQQTGQLWVQVYEGRAEALAILADQFVALGAKTAGQYQGGRSTLRVSWGRNPTVTPTAEAPVDRWELDRDPYQVPIFMHPRAVNEAEKYFKANPKKGRSSYKIQIEAAVAKPDEYPLDEKLYPFGKILLSWLAQGVEYWETTRPVLRRLRSFTLSFEGPTEKLSSIDIVFKRDSLIRAYAIPDDVQVGIPLDPDEPPIDGGVWGWRLKVQRSSYEPAKRRVEETVEWDFASWLADPKPYNSLYLLI